jgi:hypothetical protein
LAGCDHKTVAAVVRLADDAAGGVPGARERGRPTVDPFAGKIVEWVERSRGKIRADRAHERLVLMGYRGSRRDLRDALVQTMVGGPELEELTHEIEQQLGRTG